MYQVLIHLDIFKACGPDLISPRLLKEAASIISLSLANLFNKSIHDGSLPEDWVGAHITPVFKRGENHLISNYRPISLTSIVSKVLERLIHDKLYSFLEQQEVISHTQFAFRKKCSTVHLLLSAVDDCMVAEKGQPPAASKSHAAIVDAACCAYNPGGNANAACRVYNKSTRQCYMLPAASIHISHAAMSNAACMIFSIIYRHLKTCRHNAAWLKFLTG